MKNRKDTRKIMVGNVQIGGNSNVSIQSMTNTKTKDVESTVKQILELEKEGCDIIRVACLDIEDAKAIKNIKGQIHIPIVADIHFDYKIALQAVEAGVDKIRINPGNIGSEENIKKVVDACKLHNIPIRIGVNSGSLEKDLLQKYGKVTAEVREADIGIAGGNNEWLLFKKGEVIRKIPAENIIEEFKKEILDLIN